MDCGDGKEVRRMKGIESYKKICGIKSRKILLNAVRILLVIVGFLLLPVVLLADVGERIAEWYERKCDKVTRLRRKSETVG